MVGFVDTLGSQAMTQTPPDSTGSISLQTQPAPAPVQSSTIDPNLLAQFTQWQQSQASPQTAAAQYMGQQPVSSQRYQPGGVTYPSIMMPSQQQGQQAAGAQYMGQQPVSSQVTDHAWGGSQAMPWATNQQNNSYPSIMTPSQQQQGQQQAGMQVSDHAWGNNIGSMGPMGTQSYSPPQGNAGGAQQLSQQPQVNNSSMGNMSVPSAPPPQNVEYNALQGNNPQQIQNFMSALNQVGAGSNNSFMQTNNATPQAPIANIIDPTNMGSNGATAGNVYNSNVTTDNQGTGKDVTGNGNGGGSVALYTPPPPQQPSYGTTTGDAGSQGAQFMSDENTKTNIHSADNKLQSFLDNLGAHSYQYKNEKHGVGTFVSPMAQELEKTELGKSMVVETPEGKMVNYGRGFGVMLASQAMLNKRLDDMDRALINMMKRKK